MARPGFLLDEHIPRAVLRGLRLQAAELRIVQVGQPDAPALESSDPDLLRWIEEQGCLLVTRNRRSMPGHLRAHLAGGRHVPGILIVPQRLALGEIIEALHLIWAAGEPDEFQDQIVYLPLRR